MTSNEAPAVATSSFRHMLPYGGVMATAGVAVLAPVCRLDMLTLPLLALAVVQAVWIAAVGTVNNHEPLRHPWAWFATPRNPAEHCGIHTVPLGLALVTGALASPVLAGGRIVVPIGLVWALLALTWAAFMTCGVRFAAALILRHWTREDVDGSWFLVPAAILGAAVATADVAADSAGTQAAVLDMIALLTTALGWLGYWWVAGTAAWRVCCCGLGPPPRAPWWIAMGCAGLSAAAVGKVLGVAPWSPVLHTTLMVALLMAAVVAVALMLPVAVRSAWFLLRDCRFRGSAAWPPTFSTAVFALGCLAAGARSGPAWFMVLGIGSAVATLGLWAVTLTWNIVQVLRRRGSPLPSHACR